MVRHQRNSSSQPEEGKNNFVFIFKLPFPEHSIKTCSQRYATISCSDIHQHCNYLLETESLLSCVRESFRERNARPTTFQSRVTIATAVTIHKSNLARSIANSMSAAKKIERDAIRFIVSRIRGSTHGSMNLEDAARHLL
jgi:hypothetical protein